MNNSIFESHIEQLAIEFFVEQGYLYLSPEIQEQERQNLSEVILVEKLKNAIYTLNFQLPVDAREQALKSILNLPTQNLMDNNEEFHIMLTEGISVEYMMENGMKGDRINIIDFNDINNNEFTVCNQFTVIENNITRRPDIVLFVNGLPLVVIELKNPVDEDATVHKAFDQLNNYKKAIPSLFYYNSILVASDGLDAKSGTISSDWSRFSAWKTIDGKKVNKITIPQLEVLIKGMLRKDVLLDLIRHFMVFEKTEKIDSRTKLKSVVTVKKIASYHQYHAVNKAVESTIKSTAEKGNRKAGVIWHTQGSGKSLSMVFYCGRIVLELNNPTIVVITDRNDLDDQLFDTFAGCKQLLRQKPVQAGSRGHLKKLLHVSGGGIVFTTLQKFSPDEGENIYDCLSERKNIIVIADEAHRSHYGFSAKTVYQKDTTGKETGARITYGFAKYLRDGLPNASFIGFTGTPIEKEDASTPEVFGNYIDIYDIAQAVEDGATVRIYYESRLAKIHLKEDEKEKLDEEVESIIEGEESTAAEKALAKWTQLEAIVGHKSRIQDVAKDIIKHFDLRQEVFFGKAMIVAMSRRIAVELYDEIIKLRPGWHDDDKNKGYIKIVMTSCSSDPESWQRHITTKDDRKEIAERFKDPNDSLKMVIVRDMWLTGFDIPCLHTMYIDKLMRGHTLMQAIARVNRVYLNKPGGLVVDYIGFATDLKNALHTYTESGGSGDPTNDQSEAVAAMIEKYESVQQIFNGFNYKEYFTASTSGKLTIILEAQEFILGLEDGKNRFVKEVNLLTKLFVLSIPQPEALEIKDEVGFFQAIKARLVKFEGTGTGKTPDEIESAIREIVDRAVVSDGIISIFDAAGIKNPDISILSDEFLAEIRGMKRKNLALELLKKILNDEIKIRTKTRLIQSRAFSEMLEDAIRRYQNNLITTAQVIDELINLAKDIRNSDLRVKELGLTDDEMAFYDALADNKSAKDVLGDEKLRDLARVLVKRVKENTSIDWTIKESVQATLRVIIKRLLREYGYPPDKRLIATENILKQAELLADVWAE